MEWSTVAFFGIAVVAVLGLLYLLLALYAARAAKRQMDRMSEDHERMRKDMWR